MCINNPKMVQIHRSEDTHTQDKPLVFSTTWVDLSIDWKRPDTKTTEFMIPEIPICGERGQNKAYPWKKGWMFTGRRQ